MIRGHPTSSTSGSGSSARRRTWLLRRLAAAFDTEPDGFELDLHETGRRPRAERRTGATARSPARGPVRAGPTAQPGCRYAQAAAAQPSPARRLCPACRPAPALGRPRPTTTTRRPGPARRRPSRRRAPRPPRSTCRLGIRQRRRLIAVGPIASRRERPAGSCQPRVRLSGRVEAAEELDEEVGHRRRWRPSTRQPSSRSDLHRAGDVEVGPRHAADELLQEQPGRERAAVRPTDVLEVGHVAVEVRAVLRRQRQRPHRLVGAGLGGLAPGRATPSSLPMRPAISRPSARMHGAGQRGDVDDGVGAVLHRQRQAVGQHQPTLGVGVVDLHRRAVAERRARRRA